MSGYESLFKRAKDVSAFIDKIDPAVLAVLRSLCPPQPLVVRPRRDDAQLLIAVVPQDIDISHNVTPLTLSCESSLAIIDGLPSKSRNGEESVLSINSRDLNIDQNQNKP